MAKGLELDVIAEGVENSAQQQILLGFGCRDYQGYFFAKPMPIDQFETLIKADKDRNKKSKKARSKPLH